MSKSKHIYFSLDSDFLRALVDMEEELRIDEFSDFKSAENSAVRKYGFFLKEFLERAKQDEYRLLIVNTVNQENKHDRKRVNFIKKYCYFPKLMKEKNPQYATKVRNLAKKYCSPYYEHGKEFPPPMQKKYDAYYDAYVPSNDAIIMAESTLETSYLLTLNAQDFTQVKNRKDLGNIRSKGIVSINIKNEFYQTNTNCGTGSFIVPKPLSIDTICAIIKTHKPFSACLSEDSTKIKASKVLGE